MGYRDVVRESKRSRQISKTGGGGGEGEYYVLGIILKQLMKILSFSEWNAYTKAFHAD
jgi:hypothetical protein